MPGRDLGPYALDPRYRIDPNAAVPPGSDVISELALLSFDDRYVQAVAQANADYDAKYNQSVEDAAAIDTSPQWGDAYDQGQARTIWDTFGIDYVPPGQDRISTDSKWGDAYVPPQDPSPPDVQFGDISIEPSQPPDVQFGDISVAPAPIAGPPNSPRPIAGPPYTPSRASQGAAPSTPAPGDGRSGVASFLPPHLAGKFLAGGAPLQPSGASPAASVGGVAQLQGSGINAFLPQSVLSQMGVGGGQSQSAEGAALRQSNDLANPGQFGSPSLIGGDPTGLLPGTAKTARQASLQQAAQGEQQIQALGNQVTAQANAQFAQEDAATAATEASVAKENEALQQRAKDRAAAINTANVAIAAKEARADDIANREPDPGRLWDSMAGWKQATFALSMVANALANSRDTNHVNAVTQQLMGMVKDDVSSQRMRQEKQLARAKENIATAKDAKVEKLAEVSDAYTDTMTRLAALDRVAQAKAKTAGRGSQLEGAYQGLRAKLWEQRQVITAQEHTRLAGAETQARAHAQQTRMAKLEAEASFNNALAKAQGEAAKLQAEQGKDLRYVPSGSGLRLNTGKDANGNPVYADPAKAQLHKDYVKDASELGANATSLYNDLGEFQKLISDKSNLDALLKGDAVINGKMTLLARKIATNPGFNKGATTDADTRNGATVFTGLANDPNFLSTLTNLPDRMDMMKKATTSFRASIPRTTNDALKAFPLPEGGNVEWVPPPEVLEPAQEDKYLLPGERDTRTNQSINADAGIQGSIPASTRLLPMEPEQIRTVESAASQAEGMTAQRHMALVTSKLRQDTEKAIEKLPPGPGLEQAKAILLKRERDASLRYARANEGKLDELRKKEDEVARGLVVKSLGGKKGILEQTERQQRLGLTTQGLDIPEPSTADVKEQMRAAGFTVGKLSPEDIALMKRKAVEMAKNPGANWKP